MPRDEEEQGSLAPGLGSRGSRPLELQAGSAIHTEGLLYQSYLLEHVSDAIIASDLQFNITSWNPAAESIYGWSASEVIGRSVSQVLQAQVSEAGREQMARTLFECGSWRGEVIHVHRSGTRLEILASVSLVKDAAGRVVAVVAVNRDISERGRAERRLKRSEARLRAALDAGGMGTWIWDVNERDLSWDEAALRVLGRSDELEPQPSLADCVALVADEDRARVIEAVQQALQGKDALLSLEFRWRVATEMRWLHARASIERDTVGSPSRLTGVVMDITGRKQEEQELRTSRAHLLSALETGGMGTWVMDVATGTTWADTGMFRLWGRPREQLAEAPIEVVEQFIHAEDRKRAMASLEKLVREGQEMSQEFRIVLPDGAVRWLFARVRVERDALGKPLRVLGVNMDITSRKREEEARAHAQKLDALGTLAGGVAHDFNNILLAILGNAKLAETELPREHPVQESLDAIVKAGTRASELVRQILTFSRPHAQTRRVAELEPVVQEALQLVRATLPAMLEISCSYASDVPPVSVDATQVHQIVVNLATNAAHAIGSRAGRIEVALLRTERTPTSAPAAAGLEPGLYAELSVRDDGCGMSPEIAERIFDPFFTTKPPGQGTGLGLSVVHGIMKGYEGTVLVESTVGVGTCFRLFFPAVRRTNQAGHLARPTLRLGQGQRVLYVDDEKELLALITRLLSRLGYRVTTYEDPNQALASFRADPFAFDVVITDLSMPGFSGFELARALLAERSDLPVLVTSGYVRPEEQRLAARAGVREVIPKAYLAERVGSALARVFSGSTSTLPPRSQ